MQSQLNAKARVDTAMQNDHSLAEKEIVTHGKLSYFYTCLQMIFLTRDEMQTSVVPLGELAVRGARCAVHYEHERAVEAALVPDSAAVLLPFVFCR